MRYYRNKNGEKINVSKEHLDTAVQIKIELQKESPSGNCSWARHKRMMVEEGFDDSENSENYRCLIKSYQKSQGLLPDAQKHAELLSDNKLNSIRNLVGELAYRKREAQNTFRELNKVKRQVIDKTLFVDEVTEKLREINLDNYMFNDREIEKTDNSIVVKMSDWHIGLKTKNFNFDIAKKRVKEYADNIFHYCEIFNVTEVKVLGIGDLVEGGYLRPTQSYDIEFTYSEQVVKATELIIYFLVLLSKKLDVIYLGSILGNHSRMHDKATTVSGDSAENIVDASVKLFINMLNENETIDDDKRKIIIDDKKNSNFDIVFENKGKIIKAVHGDLLSKKSNEKISKFISTDNVIYDVLLYGHFHHSDYSEENNNRIAIGSGCLQGSTDYSTQLGYNTIPSQTIIVFENNNVIPIRIQLLSEYY